MPGQTYFARRMHRGLNEAYPGLKTFCGRTNRFGHKISANLEGFAFSSQRKCCRHCSGIEVVMKLVSWNVNGIRACLGKGFMDFFNEVDADIFCIQETKVQQGQVQLVLDGYFQYWNYAIKKGYSGTALFTKEKPISVVDGIGVNVHDNEGRVLTAEYGTYYVVTVYTPNSQRELARLEYRMHWEDAFRVYIKELDSNKPVILCGDLNVAHNEIDLKNPSSNRRNAGFTDEERTKMTAMLEAGFTDSYRYLYPDKKDVYTWWSYMFKAREKNVGWRIDYFMVSDRIRENIMDAKVYSDILGSDHCPVGLEIEL